MTMKRDTTMVGLFAVIALGLSGCAEHSHHGHAERSGATGSDEKTAMNSKAVAKLEPTAGNNVKGTVTFTADAGGVRVVADLSGLTPGEHGFHIHEKGDCSAPDGSSAGGHFNPTGAPHGGPDAAQHHVGDLGNITADQAGKARMDKVFSYLTMEGTNSFVGRSVVVHSGKDDFTSQPAGNAGARLTCGVIKGM